jgi:hypothetical protein
VRPVATVLLPRARQTPAKQAKSCGEVEATIGFEPMNRGFADLPLNHLGTSPRHAGKGNRRSCRSSGRAGSPEDWLPLEDSNLA